MSTQDLGLGRFYSSASAAGYTDASAASKKNNNYADDSPNVMYAGAPTQMCWGFSDVVASATGQLAIPEAYVSGIAIPFVDGLNRPILSNATGLTFEGWVEVMPSDESFYMGCNFQTHQESSGLISGSDLTNASPLLVKLAYDSSVADTTNFYEKRDPVDLLTSFVQIDSVLRIEPNEDIISSI